MSATLPSFDPSAPASGDGIFGLPHTPEQAVVVLIPVPWEPTTSYGKGAAKGPAAILSASRQVDLYDTQAGRPYAAGIAMLDPDPEIVRWNAAACVAAEPIIAAGGDVTGDAELEARLARVNELSEKLNARVEQLAQRWIDMGKIVGVVGGDHSAPYGNMAAHAARFPGLGVLHVDAHADLRDAYEGFVDSHASILFNVARRLPDVARVVQFGIRDLSEDEHLFAQRSKGRIHTVFDADVARRLFEGASYQEIVDGAIAQLPRDVYVTFDIDGLDPALCPHTGTPVPGGLSFQQAAYLFARLVETGRRIVGFDLNEVAPGPDGDEWDGNVGARLLYKLIGFAVMSRANAPAPASRHPSPESGSKKKVGARRA
jgi:agmatinase